MTGLTSMDQQFIDKLTAVIDDNLQKDDFGVAELAAELGMSRVTLHRKVKAVVKKSVSELIRETRLKRAFTLLNKKTGTVAEVAYSVGFSSPNYFSKCFHEFYGYSPGQVLTGAKNGFQDRQKQKRKAYRWNRTSGLVVLVILAGLTAGLIFFTGILTGKDKSITIVIPVFEEQNSQNSNTYLSVFRNALHDKLGECKNVNIISGPQSKALCKKIPDPVELGKKVEADYVIYGEKLVSEDDSTVNLQIINVKNGFQTWSDYYPEIQYSIYKYLPEITLTIAEILNLDLSDDEIKTIEKKPSDNILALNYYEAGLALMHAQEYGFQGTYIDAQKFFNKAIQNDSTFSEAYSQLAHIYLDLKFFLSKNMNKTPSFLDTGKVMAQKALHYDSKNVMAWDKLRQAYTFLQNNDSAQYCSIQIDKYSKKDYEYYFGRIFEHAMKENHYETINNYFKYLKLKPEYIITEPVALLRVREKLAILGFTEQALQFDKQVLEEIQIPMNKKAKEVAHLSITGAFYNWIGAYSTAQDYLLQAKEKSSKNGPTAALMKNAYYRKDYPEALKYLKELEKEQEIKKRNLPGFYQGLIYLKNGNTEAANMGFDKIISKNTKLIELKRGMAIFGYIAQLDLARVYCALNQPDKAIEYIKDCGKAQSNYAGIYHTLKNIHDFDIIRDTPEFKATYSYIEVKYSQEREKVKKLLIRERFL